MAEYPFVVPLRSAEVLAGGATPDEIRGPAFQRRSHGLLFPAHVEGDPVLLRIADAVGLMTSSCAVGGWASLRAQGNTWFDGIGSHGEERRALVHCQPGSQLRRRSILQPFRGLLHPDEVIRFETFALTTMARAVFDEMRIASSTREAVVTLDMATSTTIGRPHTTIERVERVIMSHHKVRGLAQARNALALGSARSASPWETRTRLVAELDAGLPKLQVNVPIFNPYGTLLGIADLLDEDAGLVIESDGADHPENERHTDDNRREEAFERSGLVVTRVTSLDHTDQWRTVGRIVAARRDALATVKREWTTAKPDWWWNWTPGRRWD